MDALINAAARALALGDLARARCQVAEAEIAFADRELGWPVARLEAALATLEAHGDRLNAAQVRRLNGPPCPVRARRP